jgi:hypothetical protein
MLNMSIGNIKKLIFVTVTVTVEFGYVCFSGVLFFDLCEGTCSLHVTRNHF